MANSPNYSDISFYVNWRDQNGKKNQAKNTSK